MKEWIWKVQNPFNAVEAVKTPLKDQWIFYYSKRNRKDKIDVVLKDIPGEKRAELQEEPQEYKQL